MLPCRSRRRATSRLAKYSKAKGLIPTLGLTYAGLRVNDTGGPFRWPPGPLRMRVSRRSSVAAAPAGPEAAESFSSSNAAQMVLLVSDPGASPGRRDLRAEMA